jgi:hypothetical protein
VVFFIEFLKTVVLWDAFVKYCPLCWKSHNAPGKANVSRILLSVLAGHRRYANLTALRFDGVNPRLPGMD